MSERASSAINASPDLAATARSSDADTCRENGWEAGTLLIGDEGYGPAVIQITAVGEHSILARCIHRNGVAVDQSEHGWTLMCREWSEATDRCARCGATVPPYDVEDMQVCERCDHEMHLQRRIDDLTNLLSDVASNVHGLRVNPLRRSEKRDLLASIDRDLERYRSLKEWGMRG
jgi:DNA-directed RNA polymerase subunit RPC12/RpoP